MFTVRHGYYNEIKRTFATIDEVLDYLKTAPKDAEVYNPDLYDGAPDAKNTSGLTAEEREVLGL